MSIRKEIQEYAKKNDRGKGGNTDGNYFNTNPETPPEFYDQDNIICQWIRVHHTLAFRSGSEFSPRVIQC